MPGVCKIVLAALSERASATVGKTPPHAFFVVSAVFHYLGPSFAVLLFASVAPLGVAWLRIASAAAIFAAWRRPWVYVRALPRDERLVVLALGASLAAMNAVFYLAIARLPLGTVAAIEFLGPVAVAAFGMRTIRNAAALALAVGGVYVLTDLRIEDQPLGYVFAFANCLLFTLYIVLGHRISGEGGLDRLGAAMLAAAVFGLPFGVVEAAPAFFDPWLFAAAIGVGVSSSVIPYVADQLAMARLPRSSFALMLSILPATATVIGLVVLGQVPSAVECLGVGLVVLGTAMHRSREAG